MDLPGLLAVPGNVSMRSGHSRNAPYPSQRYNTSLYHYWTTHTGSWGVSYSTGSWQLLCVLSCIEITGMDCSVPVRTSTIYIRQFFYQLTQDFSKESLVFQQYFLRNGIKVYFLYLKPVLYFISILKVNN